MKDIQQLIITNPYEKPICHYKYDEKRREHDIIGERRPAGYTVAPKNPEDYTDLGHFIELPLANQVRERVGKWREDGYPGITSITRTLLNYWQSDDREFPLFFCQIEAIETLIWLTEASTSDKQGIAIPYDDGAFWRLCSKMATGTGKTVVMAMLIAWHTCNKVTYPTDTRFSKNFLVVTPGLTVKSRLQVLNTSNENNYYREFDILPSTLSEKLNQMQIKIINRHKLAPIDPEAGHKVVKKGKESDEAFAKRILRGLGSVNNLVVINDEAHHAWRNNDANSIKSKNEKENEKEATMWVDGLDRIHNVKTILTCYDFTATPFRPSGGIVSEDQIFGWIVSDFGLYDAIESGLVKTPRIVIKSEGPDDVENREHGYVSKYYHIYPHVKDDLKKNIPVEQQIPDLVNNAYFLLGKDWLDTYNTWLESNSETPPVMITVCNNTRSSERIEHAFKTGKIVESAKLSEPETFLRIDSKALKDAEEKDESIKIEENDKATKTTKAEMLRTTVDTIGKIGQPGEQIRNIVAVNMLSEGWDAKNVTHIMGLRAFSSQLLCEQVIGRGLRRTSYEINPKTGFYDPEYVNVFGIPFSFLPHEKPPGDAKKSPETPTTRVFIDEYNREFEIKWPNITQVRHTFKPNITLDKAKKLKINPADTPLWVQLAPVLDGEPYDKENAEITVSELSEVRLQTLIFKTAKDVYEKSKESWKGRKEYILFQIVKTVENFIKSDKLYIESKYHNEENRKKALILLNMRKIVDHIFRAVEYENTESIVPIYDSGNSIRSTGDMSYWFTKRKFLETEKTHTNIAVLDNKWEAAAAKELDRRDDVIAWVKNDHMGFEIQYSYKGAFHSYRPDFLVKMRNGTMLVLEIKGQHDERSKIKHRYLDEWIKAVNNEGKNGKWACGVSFEPADVNDILDKIGTAQ